MNSRACTFSCTLWLSLCIGAGSLRSPWLGPGMHLSAGADLVGLHLRLRVPPAPQPGSARLRIMPSEAERGTWDALSLAKALDRVEPSFRALGVLSSPILVSELQGAQVNLGRVDGGTVPSPDDLQSYFGESFSQILVATCIAQGCSLVSLFPFCGGALTDADGSEAHRYGTVPTTTAVPPDLPVSRYCRATSSAALTSSASTIAHSRN